MIRPLLSGTCLSYEGDFFQLNGVLLTYKGTSPNVQIPDYISEIGWRAISCNDTITSLSFPSTFTHIYDQNVYQCPNLKTIYIPDSANYIEYKVFTECSPDLTIYGSGNSYAKRYAKEFGFNFFEISLNKTKVTFYYSNPPITIDLSITGMNEGITWSSDNTNVASVSEAGEVTILGVGKAVITADINGVLVTCNITVIEPYLCFTVLKLKKGDSYTLKLYGYSSDITWISSNSSIIEVSSNGKVTAVEAGKAVITATVNGKNYQCTVTVR